MNSRTHQNVLRRVRREAEKRGYSLRPFKKADDDAGTEYLAEDRYHDGYVLVVVETHMDKSQSRSSMKINGHTTYFYDERGWQYTAMFMNQKGK